MNPLPAASAPRNLEKVVRRTRKTEWCNVCSKEVEKLNRHLKKHSNEKPYKCTICGHKTKYSFSLAKHVKIHDKLFRKIKYNCGECGKAFSTSSAARDHKRRVHENENYRIQCVFCNGLLSSRGGEFNHILRHVEEKPYSCELCGVRSFYGTAERNAHIHSHIGEKIYNCNVCGAAFTSPENLKIHKIRLHGTDGVSSSVLLAQRFQCSICGRSLSGRSALLRHKLTHKNERPFTCDICDANYKIKRNLDYHRKSHGIQETKKTGTCTFCEKTLVLSSLNRHIRCHIGENQVYKCGICSKSFTRTETRSKHEKTHMQNRPRPHKCTACPATFTEKSSLIRHYKAKHTEKRTYYSCDKCERKYKTKQGLKVHVDIYHFNMKTRYNCLFCRDGFHSRSGFYSHILKHIGEEPYECRVCNISYSHVSSLDAHQKRKHAK